MTFRFTSFISVGKVSVGVGKNACGGKSYHNGGIEGDRFAKWYDTHLSDHFGKTGKLGDWLKGHDGKGSDGTGKGSDGTGKGSDGTGKGGGKWGHGKGSGKGSDGTGKGSDGTGKGSDGTGKGSDGTGKGGKWGKWHDKWGHDGKGTGKGSDGTGKGSDGTGKGGKWDKWADKWRDKWGDGSGKCGTGKGSDGTGKSEEPEEPGDGKTTYTYDMGTPAEISISVTQDLQGQLFVSLSQSNYDGEPADIDGIFFNLADDSRLESLNFFPDENTTGRELTDIQAEADGVTGLPNGAEAGGTFDVGLQFGLTPDSAEGTVTTTNFTLWSDDGPVNLDDIDFSGMRLIVNSETGSGEVLGVSASNDPNFDASHAAPDSEVTFDDVMGLMTQDVPEEDEDGFAEEEEDLLLDA